jgi:ankyrin repeat protein
LLLSNPEIIVNIRTETGLSPVHLAVKYGRIEALRLLLSYPGIDVNTWDMSGWTPLHLASYGGNAEAVRILMQYPGINHEVLTDKKESWWDLAVKANKADALAAALNAGNATF